MSSAPLLWGFSHSASGADVRRNEKNLNKFMQDERTKEVLDKYNFAPDKLKDIIKRNYRLGIYNVIFILNRGKNLWDLLDIYTKSPQDWTEEDKFIKANILLNEYKQY